jgi:hypothetical protein
MARGGSDATTMLAMGVIGFAAWQLAKTGAFGIRPARAVQAAAAAASGTAAPVTPAGRSSGPNPPPAPGLSLAQQYNQQNPDGSWWQVNQWSDGSYTSSVIDPGQYAAYGIPQPNTPPAGAPVPVATNNWDVAAANPTPDPNGSNNAVTYGPGDRWWSDGSTNPGGVPAGGPQYGPAPVYGKAGAPATPIDAVTNAIQGFWSATVQGFQNLQVGQTSAVAGQGGPNLQ